MWDYSKHSDIIIEAVVLFVLWLKKQNIYIYTTIYSLWYFMYIRFLTHKSSFPFSRVFLWTLSVLYYKPRNCARLRRYIAVGTCIYKVLIKFRSDFDFRFIFENHRIGENSLKLRKPEVRVADWVEWVMSNNGKVNILWNKWDICSNSSQVWVNINSKIC